MYSLYVLITTARPFLHFALLLPREPKIAGALGDAHKVCMPQNSGLFSCFFSRHCTCTLKTSGPWSLCKWNACSITPRSGGLTWPVWDIEPLPPVKSSMAALNICLASSSSSSAFILVLQSAINARVPVPEARATTEPLPMLHR